KKWIRRKVRWQYGHWTSGEYEIMQIVYETLQKKWHEDNEPTQISYFLEMAIRVVRDNRIYCDDDHIRSLVRSTLDDNKITRLGLEPTEKDKEWHEYRDNAKFSQTN
ncbi:MAG: hypothetical protein ACW99G_17880, partial [Candidatus Thorarchaeota archaeon]